jgi:hypothetical protein
MPDSKVACPHCGKQFLNNPEAQGKTVNARAVSRVFLFPPHQVQAREEPRSTSRTRCSPTWPHLPKARQTKKQTELTNGASTLELWSFGALETYSEICRVTGYVSLLAAGLFGAVGFGSLMALSALSRTHEPILPFFSALCALVFFALNGLVLFATSEGILAFIQIIEDSKKSREALEELLELNRNG